MNKIKLSFFIGITVLFFSNSANSEEYNVNIFKESIQHFLGFTKNYGSTKIKRKYFHGTTEKYVGNSLASSYLDEYCSDLKNKLSNAKATFKCNQESHNIDKYTGSKFYFDTVNIELTGKYAEYDFNNNSFPLMLNISSSLEPKSSNYLLLPSMSISTYFRAVVSVDPNVAEKIVEKVKQIKYEFKQKGKFYIYAKNAGTFRGSIDDPYGKTAIYSSSSLKEYKYRKYVLFYNFDFKIPKSKYKNELENVIKGKIITDNPYLKNNITINIE